MPQVPVLDEERDPLLAVRTMGAGDTVVLPLPMVGSYTSRTLNIVELNFDLLPDGTPTLVQTLIERLKITADEISWRVAPESPVAEILLAAGFNAEASWDVGIGGYASRLVWRPGNVIAAAETDEPEPEQEPQIITSDEASDEDVQYRESLGTDGYDAGIEVGGTSHRPLSDEPLLPQ